MECLQCIEKLADYLDGELSAAECRDIEAHLQGCPDCSKVREELMVLPKEINLSINCVSAPANLTKQIFIAINKEQKRTVKNVWITGIILILLASPILLFFSHTFLSIFRLLHAAGSVFRLSFTTLVNYISPWFTVTIGIIALIVMAVSAYTIKVLLTNSKVNEVGL